MKNITRHRPCQGCGYDLFSLSGGRPLSRMRPGIGGVRRPRKPKNPEAGAGQLRRILDTNRRNSSFVILLWLVPLVGIGGVLVVPCTVVDVGISGDWLPQWVDFAP